MSDLLQRLNAGIDVANRRLLTLRTQQDIEVALVFREILVETRDEIERLGRELTEARDGIKEVMSDHADTLARLDEESRRHMEQTAELVQLAEQRRVRLAEARADMARLLRDGIVNAPCPTPAQWRQLQDFAKGYLAGADSASGEGEK